jgi:hypothetical protein
MLSLLSTSQSPLRRQVLGTSGDTSPSLFLFTDSTRILFNPGEGTQRLCVENKCAQLSIVVH